MSKVIKLLERPQPVVSLKPKQTPIIKLKEA